MHLAMRMPLVTLAAAAAVAEPIALLLIKVELAAQAQQTKVLMAEPLYLAAVDLVLAEAAVQDK